MFEVLEVGRTSPRDPRITLAVFTYGGLHRATALCLLRDAIEAASVSSIRQFLLGRGMLCPDLPPSSDLQIDFPVQDALIDRSRAVVAKRFLEERPESDVLVMVDHDVEWNGSDHEIGYEGDLRHIARLALEHSAIVGAAVSKRVKGQGWASMIWDDGREPHSGDVSIGRPGLIRFHYLGAAFTAYPRCVLQAVSDSMEEIPPGFTPIFLPMVVPHPLDKGKALHLSEDWALSHRSALCGFKSYLATMPLTGHWGDYCYRVLGDAIPEEHLKNVRAVGSGGDVYSPRATISVLHATRGRPEMAAAAYKTWIDRAAHPDRVEYIFSYDDDDETARAHDLVSHRHGRMIAVQRDNIGCVDAYNYAAYHSTGEILVQAHDDLEPPDGWDVELDRRLDVGKPQLLHVSDGLHEDVNRDPELVTIAIGTRQLFELVGGLFNSEYASVYCDDDLSSFARAHAEVVDARDLVFPHNWDPRRDDTATRSYSPERWEDGLRLFHARSIAGFPPRPDSWEDLAPQDKHTGGQQHAA